MATTRQNLRRGLSYWMGDFVLDSDGSIPTCSAQGGANGITAIDALLTYYENDYYNDWFFVLPQGPTGSGSYEATRVVDFAGGNGGTGTLTLEPDASAQIASAQPYELHRYSPAWKHLALNNVRSQASAVLSITEVDKTLVINNLILNWDFENYTSPSFDNWVAIGAPTLTQNTSYFMHGANSANIAGAASTGIEQNILTRAYGFANLSDGVAKTLHVRAFLRAGDASNLRLRVTFDGTIYTNGSYHSGDDDFEGPDIHYIDVAIPADLTEMTISIEKSTANAGQCDVVLAWIGKIPTYTKPSAILRAPTMIEQTVNLLQPLRDGVRIMSRTNVPQAGHIMYVTGRRLLSEVTTEAGAMQVSEPEVQILYAHALRWLAESNIGAASQVSGAQFEKDRLRWLTNAAMLESMATIKRLPPPRFYQQNGVWKMRSEGETDYIILER